MKISIITINNATQIGYSCQFEYFNSSVLFHRNHDITVQLSFGDMTNDKGQIFDLSEINNLQNTEDYNILRINGITFERARITSFSFPSGNLNKNTKVTLGLRIHDQTAEDLTSLSGYFSDYGAAFDGGCIPYIESISESINISRGENSASYSKQINIKFNNNLLLQGNSHPLVVQAQAFAKRWFEYDRTSGYSNIPDIGGENQLRNILVKDFKRFVTENINLISNQCSFTENLECSNVVTDYSHSCTQVFSTGQDGVITVTERGSIQGLVEPRITKAEAAYIIEVGTNARTRMQEIFDYYKQCDEELNEDSSPKIMFISSSKTINKFIGTIEYDVSASNDPKLADSADNVMYEYTLSLAYENKNFTATENGSVEGLSSVRFSPVSTVKYPKYNQALTFFKTKSGSVISNRIKDLIESVDAVPSPHPISRSETHSPYQGKLTYTRVFSSDPRFAENDTSIKQLSLSSSESIAETKKNDFLVINEKIVVQPSLGKTQGNQSVDVNCVCYRIKPSHVAGKAAKETLLTNAKNRVSDTINSVNFLQDASYSFSYLNDVTLGLKADFYKGLDSYE